MHLPLGQTRKGRWREGRRRKGDWKEGIGERDVGEREVGKRELERGNEGVKNERIISGLPTQPAQETIMKGP